MTKPMMDLRALVEKSGDAGLLREMIGFAAERLMDLEVGAKTGADYGEKSPVICATASRLKSSLKFPVPTMALLPQN